MIFNSVLFLTLFLPHFLGLYYFVSFTTLRKIVLLIGSLGFYFWGAGEFAIFLLLLTILEYIGVYAIEYKFKQHFSDPKRNGSYFLIIVLNLTLLLYCKYTNFFVGNLNALISYQFEIWDIVQPIGLSFIVFQKVSYFVDVWRCKAKAFVNPIDHVVYMFMFTHIIAGPIARFADVGEQIVSEKFTVDLDRIINGFFRFCIGLARKVLVADVLGLYVGSMTVEDISVLSSLHIIMIGLAYTIQIYFDFAGYTDMAIGLGHMIGFKLPENFDFPYISTSVTEFWRRWHISLSSWLREYVYIPLGGSRVGSSRTYANILLTFAISGIWHGANWTFVLWGIMQGVMIILERLFLLRLYTSLGKKGQILGWFVTMVFVTTSWLLFQSKSLGEFGRVVSQFLEFNFEIESDIFADKHLILVLVTSTVMSTLGGLRIFESIREKIFDPNKKITTHILTTIVAMLLFVLSLASIVSQDFSPFIYAGF